MVDLAFAFNLFNNEKFRNGSEMEFVAGATTINFSNLETFVGLDDLIQAAI